MRTLEKFQRLEKLLAVFHQGMLQNFFTFLEVLERNDIVIEDVKWYMARLAEKEKTKQFQQARNSAVTKEMQKTQEEWKKRAKCCPLCGKSLGLDKITAAKGNANVYGYRGVWRCIEEGCLFEEFTREYPEAIYDKLMGR